jgi:acyl-CoA synthetase (AMP-forming)/AMP-acid ligase II
MGLLLGEMLRLSARRWPEKIAIHDGARSITFGAMDRDANRFANALLAQGYGKGATIAVLCGNRLEYGAILFGAARTGAVLAHISTRMTEDDLAYVLAKTRASLLVVEQQYAPRVAAVRDRLPDLKRLVVIDGDYAAFIAGGSDGEPGVKLALTDPYGISLTGGTTGRPNMVTFAHSARAMTGIASAFEFGLSEQDVGMVSTPVFHAAGQVIWFQPLVLVGATSVFMPRWDVELFMDLVERHRATAVFSVPTQLGDLVRHPKFDPARLKSLRKIDYAAAPMPDALYARLTEAFPDAELRENYGCTEGGLVTVRRPQFNALKRGSVGRAVLGLEIGIADRKGNFVPPRTTGDVMVRGAASFLHYLGDPEQSAKVKRPDGWVWTGDVGYVDEDDFLYLVDRSKDMVISGGENIYPKEIEDVLYHHAAVAECAVFGIPDERFGEALACHVVLKTGAAASPDALIEYAAAKLARHKRIKLMKIVDPLPKTAVGKIQKNVIRDAYWEGKSRVRL